MPKKHLFCKPSEIDLLDKMLKYVWYRKAADLKLQIEDLKSKALEAYSEKTDSDISDEVDQGLISLVDKSNVYLLYKQNRNCFLCVQYTVIIGSTIPRQCSFNENIHIKKVNIFFVRNLFLILITFW